MINFWNWLWKTAAARKWMGLASFAASQFWLTKSKQRAQQED